MQMITDYVEATVRQRIPIECLAPIERWILTRLFEPTETRNDLSFAAEWSAKHFFEEKVFPDDELTTALAASREICPELCAEVESEINRSAGIDLVTINYERIFHSIVGRHPDVLPFVSIEVLDCSTRGGAH